jgi:hypothetical protein
MTGGECIVAVAAGAPLVSEGGEVGCGEPLDDPFDELSVGEAESPPESSVAVSFIIQRIRWIMRLIGNN